MTHPLTDEICREVADSMIDFPNGFPDAHDHMRAGADWQLEQVIAHILAAEWFVLPEWRISELQKAMRPQQQEDN